MVQTVTKVDRDGMKAGLINDNKNWIIIISLPLRPKVGIVRTRIPNVLIVIPLPFMVIWFRRSSMAVKRLPHSLPWWWSIHRCTVVGMWTWLPSMTKVNYNPSVHEPVVIKETTGPAFYPVEGILFVFISTTLAAEERLGKAIPTLVICLRVTAEAATIIFMPLPPQYMV